MSYAAPDLRKVETSPLDTRATSNKILQHPEAEGTLGISLTTGIAVQCHAAINRAKYFKEQGINQAIAAVFVMPGCGALIIQKSKARLNLLVPSNIIIRS